MFSPSHRIQPGACDSPDSTIGECFAVDMVIDVDILYEEVDHKFRKENPFVWEATIMGHERLGALPRTKRWREVVEAIADAEHDEEQVADLARKTIRNVSNRFLRLSSDHGIQAAFAYLISLATSQLPRGEGLTSAIGGHNTNFLLQFAFSHTFPYPQSGANRGHQSGPIGGHPIGANRGTQYQFPLSYGLQSQSGIGRTIGGTIGGHTIGGHNINFP